MPWTAQFLGSNRWRIFAMLRRAHETGIPLLAALHLSVTW